jgi:capsid assembly protease
MKLLDLITGPWAIVPDRLTELQEIYATHLRGDKIDVQAVEARLGRPLGNEQKAYTVEAGGVGVLQAHGVMAPRANLFSQVSGGISTSMLAEQVRGMREDARVRSALLVLDTPGGNIQGLPAATAELRALADAKPTVTLSEGMLASAGYWFGSAANAVFAEGITDQVGSIGVYQRLGWQPKDPSAHEMVRGRFKRPSVNGEISREVLAQAETHLDYLYEQFLLAVATNRRVPDTATVHERMADGRLFIGQQALDAGLIDGFATAADLVQQLAVEPQRFAKRRRAQFAGHDLSESIAAGDAATPHATEPVPLAAEPSSTRKVTLMTRDELQRDQPALFAQLQQEFTAQGAAAERARILEVRATGLPGHDALIERLAFDGQTTGAQAAQAVLAAERQLREQAHQAHRAEAPPAASAAPNGEQQSQGEEGKERQSAARASIKPASIYDAMNKGAAKA